MNLAAQKLKQVGNDAYKKKDFAMALKNYGKAIELEPNEITYYNNTAAVCFEMKNFDECIKFCRQACKIGEKHGAQSKFIFKGFERMGRAHKEMGDLKMAKLVFEKAKIFLEKAQKENDASDYEKCLSEIELAIDCCQIKVSQNLKKGFNLWKLASYLLRKLKSTFFSNSWIEEFFFKNY